MLMLTQLNVTKEQLPYVSYNLTFVFAMQSSNQTLLESLLGVKWRIPSSALCNCNLHLWYGIKNKNHRVNIYSTIAVAIGPFHSSECSHTIAQSYLTCNRRWSWLVADNDAEPTTTNTMAKNWSELPRLAMHSFAKEK